MTPTDRTPKDWSGRYFEDLDVGDVFRSRLGRTVTEADNVWFTCLTMNTNQVHFNEAFAVRTRVGRPLVKRLLHARARDRAQRSGPQRECDRAPRLGRRQAPRAGVGRRHALGRERGPRAPSLALEPGQRPRLRADARAQSTRRGRDRVPADVHAPARDARVPDAFPEPLGGWTVGSGHAQG